MSTPSPDLIDACGASPGVVCEWVFDATDSRNLAKAAQWAVDVPVRIGVIVVIAWLVLVLIRWALRRTVERLAALAERAPFVSEREAAERAAQRTRTLGTVLRSAATGAVWIVATLAVLSVAGLDVTALAFGTAALGAGLGFGAQTLVRDVLAGMFLLLEDQCSVGDEVHAGAVTGTVEKITLRATRIRDGVGTVWHVSNGEIRQLGNRSRGWAVVLLDVAIDHEADVDRASSVIADTARALRTEATWTERIVSDPQVLGIEDVGDDRITLRLSVRTTPGEQAAVMRELRARLRVGLADAGVTVPRAAPIVAVTNTAE